MTPTIGNYRWRVEGNSFAYHGDAANRLFASLAPAERERAILPEPPHELVLQVQRAGAAFPGVRVGVLGEPAQDAAAQLLDSVFGCLPDAGRARAMGCIEANGGAGALHFSVYESRGFYPDMAAFGALDPAERARRGDPYWQVWRLEGPGAIVHFQGHPHVHAYVRVVNDPLRANLGESLGETAAAIEGEAMRRLLEGALRRATGEALAFHGADVPGRFCPGEITTGLAWSLDPYRNRVAVATIEGRAMAAPLHERVRAAGVAVEPERHYRVATPSWYAASMEAFGEPERVERSSLLLRDALVEHLRAGGLADATASEPHRTRG